MFLGRRTNLSPFGLAVVLAHRKLGNLRRYLIVGDILSRPEIASASDQVNAKLHTGGTGIGPSTKMPRPRSATAIKPASTPVGTSNALPLNEPAFAMLPVTLPSEKGAAVSTLGSSSTPYALASVPAVNLPMSPAVPVARMVPRVRTPMPALISDTWVWKCRRDERHKCRPDLKEQCRLA
jgi:hypothetical protein